MRNLISVHPEIKHRRVQNGSVTIKEQVLRCSHPDCSCEFTQREKHGPIATIHFFRQAIRAGWEVHENRRRFFCPDHKGT